MAAAVTAEGTNGRVGKSALTVHGSNRGSQTNAIYLISDEIVADDRLTRMMATSLSFF